MFWSCVKSEVDYTENMDGFNVIPVGKESANNENNTTFSAIDPNIELIDEKKEAEKKDKAKKGGRLYFVFSIITFMSVVFYFGFLVLLRINNLALIGTYSSQLKDLTGKLDVTEMQNFQAMDIVLKTINGKLSKHVLNSTIVTLINQNLRSNLQITEYRLDVKEKEVEVNISSVAPSFKEVAEQTEKFYQMKSNNELKSFTVTNLSFEAETKKVKFSLRLVFDKARFTALSKNLQQ